MNKNIYVGNLSYSVTDQQLLESFSAHGAVESARVITDKFSGNSRGFGFVEMSTQEEAEKAIEVLNGSEIDGRALNVNMAKPREERSRGGEGGNSNRW